MRTHLAALVVIGIVWGLSTAHATETSSKPEASKSQDLPAIAPDAEIATKESRSSITEKTAFVFSIVFFTFAAVSGAMASTDAPFAVAVARTNRSNRPGSW